MSQTWAPFGGGELRRPGTQRDLLVAARHPAPIHQTGTWLERDSLGVFLSGRMRRRDIFAVSFLEHLAWSASWKVISGDDGQTEGKIPWELLSCL